MIRRLIPQTLAIVAALLGCLPPGGQAQSTDVPSARLKPGDRVALCGDSITEYGGYSAIVGTYLLACQPTPNLNYKSFGWAGETAGGFRKRLPATVLPHKPNVVTILYGMNDGAYKPEDQATVERFRENIYDSLEQLKAAGVRQIILSGPTPVDPILFDRTAEKRNFATTAAEYNETLAALAKAAAETAGECNVTYVPLQQSLLDLMKQAKQKYGNDYAVVGEDGFHPQQNGGLLIAELLLKAMGCHGDIGTFTLDMSTGKATASADHRIVSSSANALEVESKRYPFCFVGEPGAVGRNGALLEFSAFNRDLNRFLLVITNPPADRLKVTWGEASRVFTASELKEGINLADAFPVTNPFAKPFYKLYWELRKQNEESNFLAMKRLWSITNKLENLGADSTERSALEAEAAPLIQKISSLDACNVPPVSHRISIEPATP